jgi:CheY-like chemotaxis protein
VLDVQISLGSNLGQGSRFSVNLAAVGQVQTEEPFAAIPTVPQLKNAKPSLKILVVEDDLANQEAMRAFLASRDHDFDCIGDAQTASEIGDAFDCALVDYHLGGAMTGLDVIEALSAHHPSARFALTTAASEDFFLERAQAMQVAVFRKPVDPDALDQWLAQTTVVSGRS